jgi:hypothetical protein
MWWLLEWQCRKLEYKLAAKLADAIIPSIELYFVAGHWASSQQCCLGQRALLGESANALLWKPVQRGQLQ